MRRRQATDTDAIWDEFGAEFLAMDTTERAATASLLRHAAESAPTRIAGGLLEMADRLDRIDGPAS